MIPKSGLDVNVNSQYIVVWAVECQEGPTKGDFVIFLTRRHFYLKVSPSTLDPILDLPMSR